MTIVRITQEEAKTNKNKDTHIPNAGKADVFDVRFAVLRGLAAGVLVRSK